MADKGSITYLLTPSTVATTPKNYTGSSESDEELQRHERTLIQLARAFTHDGNTGEFTTRHHFAPECRVAHQGCADMTLEEYIHFLRNMKATYPAHHVEPLSESVDLDIEERKAAVWMWMRVTGIPEGVTRKALGLWKFRLDRKSGGWLLYQHITIAGSNEMALSQSER